jgi:hypothetical protein
VAGVAVDGVVAAAGVAVVAGVAVTVAAMATTVAASSFAADPVAGGTATAFASAEDMDIIDI